MLSVSGVSVSFGGHKAIDRIDLDVGHGEVVAILGPSGCGKSTLLRAIAGLQPLTEGAVLWDGNDLESVPVHKRDFGLMFQEHALFSHRDVAANVAFGLRMQKMPTARRRHRVTEVLALVGLQGYGPREVATLSGGEAQRVALARSLAPEPRLLMLDEPLGSLDRPRREALTAELRSLLRDVGVTVLYVTHDHDEAFEIADRVAVMQAGRIARIGTPADVWHDPRRADVARFLRHTNFIDIGQGGRVPWGSISTDEGTSVIRSDAFTRASQTSPTTVPPANIVQATVMKCRFRGDRYELTLKTDPGAVELVVRDRRPATPGDYLRYHIDPQAVVQVSHAQ